jgi:hypothetical protein
MPLALAIISCALAAGTCHAAASPDVRSYAVRVTAPAGAVVGLRALDVPRGWTASFCTPRVCSPQHVSLAIGAGAGLIQLSYVQTVARAEPLRVLRVAARSAAGVADVRRLAVR